MTVEKKFEMRTLDFPSPRPAGRSLRENATGGRGRRKHEARGNPSRSPAKGEAGAALRARRTVWSSNLG